MSFAGHVLLGLLAFVGVAAIALALMLAWPVRPPPTLASIHEGAMQHRGRERARSQPLPGARRDLARLPALSRGERRARPDRDPGAWLVGPVDRDAPIAKALAAGGVTAVAVDFRGHGASGTRGDVAYLGQLDDDLADLIAELRKANPAARFSLIGHSAGGGFALRVAGEPLGGRIRPFRAALALSRLFRADQPAGGGPGLWASPDLPRIIATVLLGRLGVDWPQSLPVIAFANPPEAKMAATSGTHSGCCRTTPPRPTGRARSSAPRAASPSLPAPTTN